MALSSGGPGRSPQRENRTGSNQIGENLRSTQRWNDVPRGTMDEVSSYVRLNLPLPRRQGRAKDCSTSSSNPMMEGPWCRVRREARARERHRHRSVDSLKVLDPDGRLEKRRSGHNEMSAICPLSRVKRTTFVQSEPFSVRLT